MDRLGQYILSVVSAAVISGILSSTVSSKSTAGGLIRMLCGLFLAFAVIAPLGRLNYDVLSAFSDTYFDEGVTASAQGEKLARESVAEIIKQETEAYILDKAAAMQVQISVEVTVSQGDSPIPEQVTVVGTLTLREKRLLQEMIETELGIPEERQQWIS